MIFIPEIMLEVIIVFIGLFISIFDLSGLWAVLPLMILLLTIVLISPAIFLNLLFYAQEFDIWRQHDGREKIDAQRHILKLYLAGLAAYVLGFLSVFILSAILREKPSFFLKNPTGVYLKLWWGGGMRVLLTLYCLQFFKPTPYKRMIFDGLFFSVVVLSYIFLVRAVF